LEEIELDHLDGHKGSRPVRIGNGAADHIQLVSLYSCGMNPLITMGAGYLWRTVSFGADPFRSRLITFSRMDCIYLGQKVMRRFPIDLELLTQPFPPVRETIGTLIVSTFFTNQLRPVSLMSQSYDDWYVSISWSIWPITDLLQGSRQRTVSISLGSRQSRTNFNIFRQRRL